MSYFKTHSISTEEKYGALKKAFPIVIKELQKKELGCIEDNGKKKGIKYRYVGKDDDPLS